MLNVLTLLAIQGVIGAFDTVYYHEWRARLPGRRAAAPELRIHALRDFFYALLFGSLPWVAWHGQAVWILVVALLAEIILTMTDFVVEIRVRKPIGDVYGGERITHAVMAILYGAMMANLTPVLWQWWAESTGLPWSAEEVPDALRWCLTVMAGGVFISGVRDLYAALGLPGGGWPWAVSHGHPLGGRA